MPFDFLIFSVLGVGYGLYILIYWLVTGHAPQGIEYGIWGLIALSILKDAESKLNEARDASKEAKAEISGLKQELESIGKQIETIDWHLTQFKINFDEFAEEAKNQER